MILVNYGFQLWPLNVYMQTGALDIDMCINVHITHTHIYIKQKKVIKLVLINLQ